MSLGKESPILSEEQTRILDQRNDEICKLEAEAFHYSSDLFPRQTAYSCKTFDHVSPLVETIDQAFREVSQESHFLLQLESNFLNLKPENTLHPMSNFIEFNPQSNISSSNFFSDTRLATSNYGISTEDPSQNQETGNSWVKLGLHLQTCLSEQTSPKTLKKKKNRKEENYHIPVLKNNEMDIYGFSPVSDPLSLVQCNNCAKSIKTSYFSYHLKKCLKKPDSIDNSKSETFPKKKKVEQDALNKSHGENNSYDSARSVEKEKKKSKPKQTKGTDKKENESASIRSHSEKKDKKEKKIKSSKKTKKKRKEEHPSNGPVTDEKELSQTDTKGEKKFKKINPIEDIKLQKFLSSTQSQHTFQIDGNSASFQTYQVPSNSKKQTYSLPTQPTSLNFKRVSPMNYQQLSYQVQQFQNTMIQQNQNTSTATENKLQGQKKQNANKTQNPTLPSQIMEQKFFP